MFHRTEKLSGTYQEIYRVFWSDLTALDEALGESGHDVLHQIIPQRNRLSFQQLILLLLNLL